MLSSGVLSIGKEIVSGYTLDSNSSFLARRLVDLGFYNRFVISVDDVEEDIVWGVRFLLSSVDVVITTGGLGPTFDDITMLAVAHALESTLVRSDEAYAHVESFYKRLADEGKIAYGGMNEKRKKMAYLPEGAVPLKNSVGAAFGAFIEKGGKMLFVLPGVPSEMKAMFEEEVVPRLRGKSGSVRITEVEEFEINDESVLGMIIDGIDVDGLHIKSLPTGFESKVMGVRFTAVASTESEAREKIAEAKKRISLGLSELSS